MELYESYAALVYSVAYRVVESQQDAEEISQDVFMRIWHKSELFDPAKGTWLAWLLTMTRRLAIDYLRRQHSQPAQQAISLDEHDYLWETALVYEDLSDLHRTLLSSLQTLPHEYREALQLAYFKGMTHQDIAQYLGKPLGTIKSHIRQGMQQLREIWITSHNQDEFIS